MGIGADRWRRERQLTGRRLAGWALLALLTLASVTGWGDDRKPPPAPPPAEDPDPGFLEFLGSVDQLSDVNPDYLSPQGQPPGTPPPKAASPPQPSPPSSGTPPPPSTTQARISSDD